MSEVEHEHGTHTNEYKHMDEHGSGGTQRSMEMWWSGHVCETQQHNPVQGGKSRGLIKLTKSCIHLQTRTNTDTKTNIHSQRGKLYQHGSAKHSDSHKRVSVLELVYYVHYSHSHLKHIIMFAGICTSNKLLFLSL